jgi:hypothetical protein
MLCKNGDDGDHYRGPRPSTRPTKWLSRAMSENARHVKHEKEIKLLKEEAIRSST